MKDKIAFITGASSGIGEETAYQFAKRQWRLVITYHTKPEDGERAAEQCRRLGAGEVLLLRLELVDEESIRAAVKAVAERFGQIDVLINNAATLARSPLLDQSFAEIERQIKVNLEGTIKLTKACLPFLRTGILNVGSNLAFTGKANLAVYTATKFAIRGFTQALAQELPHLKIYSIHPGLTATAMGNAQGVAPALVAEIIFRAATGYYHLPSGSEIKVRYYLHGSVRRKILRAWDLLKKLLNR